MNDRRSDNYSQIKGKSAADQAASQKESFIEINIAGDRMRATLTVRSTKDAVSVTQEDVLQQLRQAGIKFGIDQAAIRQALERPNVPVICAVGQPPVNGRDACIKFHIDCENIGHPVELEDGRVDFKNLNKYITVSENQVIAEKIPATDGLPGYDILGKRIPAKPGKDVVWPVGKNVRVEGNAIVAACAGHLVIENNKINVIPVIKIKGDVDFSTGNIKFTGNVIIHGSVQTGFSVITDGDVEIFGAIEGGTVEARNITVHMGIKGINRGYIKARENLTAKFIENAVVDAGNEVRVYGVILHSRTSAGKRVIVSGRRAAIIGGLTAAGEEICAKTAGNQFAATTELQVGVNPSLRIKYEKLLNDFKESEQLLDKTNKAIAILQNQTNLPPQRQEMLAKLITSKMTLFQQIQDINSQIKVLQAELTQLRSARIRISGTVNAGVKITVGTQVMFVHEPLTHCSFYHEDGELKIGSF